MNFSPNIFAPIYFKPEGIFSRNNFHIFERVPPPLGSMHTNK